MPVYIVTYDLNNETVRPAIVEEVKESPGWARLSESSYTISTPESPSQVHQRFKQYLDQDDNFYVISLHKPWDGYGPKKVNEWLDENLTSCR